MNSPRSVLNLHRLAIWIFLSPLVCHGDRGFKMVRLVRVREVDILLHPTRHNLFFYDLLKASFETSLLLTNSSIGNAKGRAHTIIEIGALRYCWTGSCRVTTQIIGSTSRPCGGQPGCRGG